MNHRLTKESSHSLASGAAFSTASQCSPYNSPALIYGIIYGQLLSVSNYFWQCSLQLAHAGENIILCILKVHLMLLQSVWQLKPDYMYSSSSGAGGKSVSIGFFAFFPLLMEKDHPRCLSTAVSEGIHGGCDISSPLMCMGGKV